MTGSSGYNTTHGQSERRRSESIPMDLWAKCTILATGSFVSMLTATVINAGLPALGSAFGQSFDSIQWVATVYILAMAATIPASGWLGRRFGVTVVWLYCLAAFTFLSCACAIAPSISILVAFRILLGLVGGILVPTTQMQLVLLAGPGRLGRIMAVLGLPIIVAPALGLSMGGALLSWGDWPALFWINVPIGFIALSCGWKWLPRVEKMQVEKLDVLGLVVLSSAIPLLIWGLTELTHSGGQGNGVYGLWAAGMGTVFLSVFLFYAIRTPGAILKVRLLARSQLALSACVILAFGFVAFGAQIALPLYYLFVRGESADTMALLVLPQAIGIGVALPLAGWLTDKDWGSRSLVIGMALTILGTTGLALAEVHTSNILLGSLLFLRGVGLSMVSMPALTGALVGLERENVPNAVPLMNVLNRVGGALGTAIVTAVYAAGKTNLDGPAAALAGFSRANWTLVAVVVLSLVPAIALAIMEFRRTRRQTQG